MLTINGHSIAESKQEMVQHTAQTSTPSCTGYIKRFKRRIDIFNLNDEKVGVINHEGVIGKARLLENGRYWYSYCDVELFGHFDSYRKQRDFVESLAIDRDHRGFCFR